LPRQNIASAIVTAIHGGLVIRQVSAAAETSLIKHVRFPRTHSTVSKMHILFNC